MNEVFEYGSIVTEDLFIGREDQIKELILNIKSSQNCIIYGDRRVGKTSLIYEAIRRYKEKITNEKFLVLNLDLSTCTQSKDFIELFSTTLNKELKKHQGLKAMFTDLSNFIKSIRPTAKINSITGEIEHSINFVGSIKDLKQSLTEIMELIESIAIKKYKILIVMDEFHMVSYWKDSEEIQWQLRSRLQLQKNISYIFAGSSRKLITEIFTKSSNALYRCGPLIFVENTIDYFLFADWIKARFHLAKIKITGEAIKKILDISKSHPYYTQKLCYALWIEQCKINENEINMDNIFIGIKKIIDNEKYTFKERLEKLSYTQQNVLHAIAILEARSAKISLKNIKEHTQIVTTSIQGALKHLEQLSDQIIIKNDKVISLEDPFFSLWLSNQSY